MCIRDRPGTGAGLEMDAIGGVFVGGVAATGGYGSVIGTFVGDVYKRQDRGTAFFQISGKESYISSSASQRFHVQSTGRAF